MEKTTQDKLIELARKFNKFVIDNLKVVYLFLKRKLP